QDMHMRHIGEGNDDKPSVLENFLLGFQRASLVDCNTPLAREVADLFDIYGQDQQQAFIVVDKMPVPNFLSRSRYNAAEVELTVTGVHMLPMTEGLPIPVILATTDAVDLL